jgi:hypothetical protein
MIYTLYSDGQPVVTGDEYRVRETIEILLEHKIGISVSLQEHADEEGYSFYLHSDNDEDLSESALKRLDEEYGINTHDDENSEFAICKLLKLTIKEHLLSALDIDIDLQMKG